MNAFGINENNQNFQKSIKKKNSRRKLKKAFEKQRGEV